MEIDVSKVTGIGEYSEKKLVSEHSKEHSEGKSEGRLFLAPGEKAFLVLRSKTLEVRCEPRLRNLLEEKYETVMESRYFGKGGIEIVPSGQLTGDEIEDLIRLSYNLTISS